MFTGIVQGVGKIVRITHKDNLKQYQVKLPNELTTSLVTGASIAHDGCCVTVTEIDDGVVTFDVMEETLLLTTLGSKKEGDHFNVERAARIGDEIGGHLMSGHIACQGKIIEVIVSKDNHQLSIELPKAFAKYILYKGFVGIDGISLTVGQVTENKFKLHLIPETLHRTTLGSKQKGDEVNIEIDSQTQAIVDTIDRIMSKKM